MEGKAMRLTLVFALVVATFLAANQQTHFADGSRSPSFKVQQSPSPSPEDLANCHPHECEASCRADLREEYISFQCIPTGRDVTVGVCFIKDVISSPTPNVAV
ncbi:hypothetical protein C1H46_015238 [Malus baccata]|uniref:Uncharacterized protein n=1 Tax=Malus baccata TaxID=106549 RepID=A0A540ML42_MALBA|nr:hypothetical protein C1H46_015238 [Malus baccata]